MSNMEMHQLLQEMDRVMGKPLDERMADEAVMMDAKNQKLLKDGVKNTRQFVRNVDNLLAAAADLAPYLNVTSDVPSERNLAAKVKKFANVVDSMYGQYVEGRSDIYKIMKEIGSGNVGGSSWKWTGKTAKRAGPKVRKHEGGSDITKMTDAQLVDSVAGIVRWVSKDTRVTAERGATFLRRADEYLKKIQMGTVEAMDLPTLLDIYLDFRDGTSTLFATIYGLYKRAKEADKRVRERLNLEDRDTSLEEAADKLDLENDPDIKELL